MAYTIYLRTNKVNGMQYVGQTGDFKQREMAWKKLSTRYANLFLTKDREKYGLDNFETSILAEVGTQEEAWELEQKYIKELGTKYPDGYNMSDGGQYSNGYNHSLEAKQKMSEKAKGKHRGIEYKKGHIPWNKDLKNCFSEEVIEKMSEKRKGKHNSPDTEFKKGMTPWIKGKKHSKEANEKNRQAHLGKISKKRIAVLQIDPITNEVIKEFSHCAAAAQEMGFKSEMSIRKACKETWRTSGGFKWKYADQD